MKAVKLAVASLLFIVLAGGCASLTTDRASVPLPPGTLNRAEVTALFSDHTVESVLDSNRRVSFTYYNPNGGVRQLQNGQKRSGLWRVRDNGRICLQLGAETEQCRIIVKEVTGYSKYIVKKNGQHQRILTYTSFVQGNMVDR